MSKVAAAPFCAILLYMAKEQKQTADPENLISRLANEATNEGVHHKMLTGDEQNRSGRRNPGKNRDLDRLDQVVKKL